MTNTVISKEKLKITSRKNFSFQKNCCSAANRLSTGSIANHFYGFNISDIKSVYRF